MTGAVDGDEGESALGMRVSQQSGTGCVGVACSGRNTALTENRVDNLCVGLVVWDVEVSCLWFRLYRNHILASYDHHRSG